MTTLGLLLLALAAGPPTTLPTGLAIEAPRVASEPEASAAREAPPDVPGGAAATVEPSATVEPRHDALEHLARAHEREAAGELDEAEAEVSTAISLAPDEAPPYLARAQIRMALADRFASDDPAARRARAALLRLAAQDVAAYVRLAALPSDGVTWFLTRQEALLREAEALDPPQAVVRPQLEPEPEPEPVRTSWRSSIDVGPRARAGAWIGTGAVAAGTGVGLAALALRIEQRCGTDGYCGARWRANVPFLVPAAALATLGTTAIAIGLAGAPALDRPGPRRAVLASGFALGATAAVLGTITAAIMGARWSAPASPSDDASLAVTQALGNASAASFTAALPLLGAGVGAWVRGRMAGASKRVARRAH